MAAQREGGGAASGQRRENTYVRVKRRLTGPNSDLTPQEAMEFLQKQMVHTRDNEEFLYTMDK